MSSRHREHETDEVIRHALETLNKKNIKREGSAYAASYLESLLFHIVQDYVPKSKRLQVEERIQEHIKVNDRLCQN